MEHLLYTLDWLLYILFAINVAYLLVCSLASLCRYKPFVTAPARTSKRFAVFIAAYREDAVILPTVHACLAQDYPDDRYDVVVISDHMRPETNAVLSSLPIKLLQVDFEKSTNTKSLQAALGYLDKAAYDIALVIDADNIIAPSYLSELNDAFSVSGVRVVQTHRIVKQGIFKGHARTYQSRRHSQIDMSQTEYGIVYLLADCIQICHTGIQILGHAMMDNTSVGGFDRVLEMKLLYKGIHIHYLPDTIVRDEKIQKANSFYRQRRRWLSAQYYSFFEFANHLLPAIRSRKWDFCDKLYQQISLSRVLLLGFVFIISLAHSLFASPSACKWWGIFILLLLALALAIPRKYWKWRLLKAVCWVPYSFLLMLLNLFRLKEANRRFIHTTHGVD